MPKEQNSVNNGTSTRSGGPRRVLDIINDRVTPLDKLNKAWAENKARRSESNLGESEQEPPESLLGESEQEPSSPGESPDPGLSPAPSPKTTPPLSPAPPPPAEAGQPAAAPGQLSPGIYANPHDRYTYQINADGSITLDHPVTGRSVLRPGSADPRVQKAIKAIEGQIADGTLKAGVQPFQLPLKTERA